MKQQKLDWTTNLVLLWGFIVISYLFSMGVRMYWPLHFIGVDSMRYAGELMINTNDGYFFAHGARDILSNSVSIDAQKASAFHVSSGLVLLTAYLAKLTPFSLDTVILYLPGIISSLIVIPIILTARLMGHTFLGFLSALLGSIAWSYYNRTMVGYYDTDMFSVLIQFSIFYTFLHIAYKKELKGVLFASVLIFAYPYFYPQGMSLVYAMYILLTFYLVMEYTGVIKTKETKPFKSNDTILYISTILLSIPLMLSVTMEIKIVLFILMLILSIKGNLKEKNLLYLSVFFFILFLVFGNVLGVIWAKVFSYLDRGVEVQGLHFYQVIQTVREAGAIPFSTMANRISGSQVGVILSLLGYVVLVFRHKSFIIALPLIGVGILSLWAGLRFTVYAVPVAAISAIYFFYFVSNFLFKKNILKYLFITMATIAMLYPNIIHIIGYKVPTVLNKAEVQDLEKLKKLSNPKDYTLTWWDYGYPIWYYSNTNTLIDGGKHTKDNFIVSTLLQTTSPQLLSNLGKLSVETYVKSNYSIVANTLFKNDKKDQPNPNLFLEELKDSNYKLPKKTRDTYLYMPYRMLNIFPTVCVFGNLDLKTGKKKRDIKFYPTSLGNNKNGLMQFRNGIVFDAKQGKIRIGRRKGKIKYFVITQNQKNGSIGVRSQIYHIDGEYVVVYMKSYNRFIVMDTKTFNSMYVQMFILGKYDKNLFELVVSSPYSKIYKIK